MRAQYGQTRKFSLPPSVTLLITSHSFDHPFTHYQKMRSFSSAAGIAALVFGLVGVCSATSGVDTSVPGWDRALQQEGWTCLTPPRRTQPGRSVSFSNTVCPGQINTCEALCKSRGGVVEGENACVSNNGGVDNPFNSNTYCFICNCKDGALPDLETYYNTVPRYRCEIRSQNCFYGYNQGGQLPPDGACRCPEAEYAVPPSWYSLLPKTTTTSTVIPPSSTSVPVPQTSTSAAETSSTSDPVTVTDTVIPNTSTGLTTIETITTAPTSESTLVVIETTTSIFSNGTAPVPTQKPIPTGGSTRPVVGVVGAMVAALLAM
ncbi:hypothetical protein QC764_608240 [Podospora pseudoanserina]|uniref:DUF7707 domain-containing protein n=1 Tax=Podospora pseudoanserina TaxID=2609844 RepID=A0ABR0HUI1_9PEZI|nr:hypothetical protein QC764_608240 [Podospora pseudoanserina]